MTDKIKKLIEYQEADIKLDAAEKKIKSCKERKTANLMKQRFELAVEERKKLISSRDEAEKELEAIIKEVDKLVALADVDRTANTPEEVAALKKLIGEIDKLVASLKKAEERVKALNASVSESEKKINEYGLIATKAKEEFNSNKAEYEKILNSAKPELDKLKEERDLIGKDVDRELLNKYLGEDNPVCINQLQFSPTNTTMIDAGVNVYRENEGAVNRDGSVLDYCRLKGITIQPWSPFQFGFFNGVFLDNPKFPELNAKINEMAEKYGTTNTGMVVSWILRHPAAMQPIIGTTPIERVQQIAAASDVDITREDWYAIYKAAGNQLP